MENGMNNTSLVEELLKKAINECNDKHKLINEKFDALRIEIEEISRTKEKYVKELQYVCLHARRARVDGAYLPGGYDHVSEEHYTIECVNCGKVLESKCIRGSYA